MTTFNNTLANSMTPLALRKNEQPLFGIFSHFTWSTMHSICERVYKRRKQWNNQSEDGRQDVGVSHSKFVMLLPMSPGSSKGIVQKNLLDFRSFFDFVNVTILVKHHLQ